MWFWFLCVATAAVYSAEGAGAGAARLLCYVESARASDFTECTHLVYAGNLRGDKLNSLLKDYRKNNPRLKIILRVTELDKDLTELLKTKNVQGLEVHDAHRSFNKTKVLETLEEARTLVSKSGGGPLFLSLPAHPELLAKYYDLRALVKKADLMSVQTHALGLVKKMTYHPSRLSGLWDMMNTDSVVDLVVGLGVPASKIIISLPATARQFTLQNETLSTPGSPTTEDEPKEIDQAELCRQLRQGRWTLERDQDLSAPYAFKDKTWISFEDSSSVDVKGKYARVRGLAGLALFSAERDTETGCGPSLRSALAKVLNQQSRAPRAAVLRSLENEILSAPSNIRALDALQVSPYRITQVVDSDGVIHSLREDTRTEFSCSRQGYFVHPRSCARFYRCVKFDQLSPDYTVFEFDCPAGLAFDARYEVCVWPGSLPHSQACPGSSEIAPVPRTRFVCPEVEGYYADPENCRWFFACLDHGKGPLSAYEFRCPFGLGFDAARLKCDWPWAVPACGNIGRYEAEAFGFSGAILSGAAGFGGQTAESINVAAHQSLISGASTNNLVGIQGGLLTKDDVLDANFIASQELANGLAGAGTYEVDSTYPDVAIGGQGEYSGVSYNFVPAGDINQGLLSSFSKNGEDKYSSGSIILDEFRSPVNSQDRLRFDSGKYRASNTGQYIASDVGKYSQSNAGKYIASDAGKYRANAAGQYVGGYTAQYRLSETGQYRPSNSGKYVASNAGKYVASDAGKYRPNKAGLYRVGNDGKYRPEIYSAVSNNFASGKYVKDDSGKYIHNPIGDRAKPYEHIAIDPVPYQHIDIKYKDQKDYNSGILIDDQNRDSSSGYQYPKPTIEFNEGPREQQNLYTQQTNLEGDGGNTYESSYSSGDVGSYVNDNKVYTGASHTLTAGAINVGLVGKTTLVEADYGNRGDNEKGSYNQNIIHETHVDAEPSVSISSGGINIENSGGYTISTTPTSLGVPTTTTPLAITSFKTTYVPEVPKTSIKQIFGYTQPAVTYVQPSVITVKQTVPAVQFGAKQDTIKYSTKDNGYEYSKPSLQFQEGISYTTPTPIISVTKQTPVGFSQGHQTIHTIESVGFDYANIQPVNEPPFKKAVAYTTGTQVTFEHPTAPTVVSNGNYVSNINTGSHTSITHEIPHVSQVRQNIVSSYEPQSFVQQTLHTGVSGSSSTLSQPEFNKYSQQEQNTRISNYDSGFEFTQPTFKLEETPVFSTIPKSYSSQSVNIAKTTNYIPVTSKVSPVSVTPLTFYENPLLNYKTKITPAVFTHTYNLQTNERFSEPKSTTFTTAKPTVSIDTSTAGPTLYSQQTLHTVDGARVNTYEDSLKEYDYTRPANFQSSKAYAPTVTSTVTPSFNKQLSRQEIILSTSHPRVELTYQQPAVSIYENPLIKYTQKISSASYVEPTATVYKQTFTPTVQQNKLKLVTQQIQYQTTGTPLISESVELNQNLQGKTKNTETPYSRGYSDATLVSHQVFNLGQENAKSKFEADKNIVFVSTTPSTLVYEDHYVDTESPKILSKNSQFFTISTTEKPSYRQNFVSTQDQVDYKPVDNYQQVDLKSIGPTNFETNQYEFGTTKPIQSFNLPSTRLTNQYNNIGYQSPEIQVAYKAEEYLPPVVSTTTIYKPQIYKTTSTSAPEYLPPIVNTYLPPSTVKPKESTLEYLPPIRKTKLPIISVQTNSYDAIGELPKSNVFSTVSTSTPTESTVTNIPRKQNIVVQSAKSNLLGFGTVGPDAGLVSTPYYTTARPIITSTENYFIAPQTATSTYVTGKVTSAPRTRPFYVKSTTPIPVEISTAYKAPEYLPPLEEEIFKENLESFGLKSTTNLPEVSSNPYNKVSSLPVQFNTSTRKQNIVIETAKSQLLGFDAVGSNAGLVTDFGSSSPSPLEVSKSYISTPVTSTFASTNDELVGINPTRVPIRKLKPKVAVVTKLNDFNPLLVRKLGAVCSCQSPVLVLKGRRPNAQTESNVEYELESRGDIDDTFESKPYRTGILPSSRLRKVTTVAPIITSTINPIIVPDDSFYQDYQELASDNFEVTSDDKSLPQTSYNTPVSSTTERIVEIVPHSQTYTTLAPTLKTVLLKQRVTPRPVSKESVTPASEINSKSFDRYGPGGWRSRDETLQGSIDCQRAGLFRHPKQCNKFYSCRWDCTKQRFTLHVFNCPIQLSFDPNLGACNWPSQGPACQGDTLLTNGI